MTGVGKTEWGTATELFSYVMESSESDPRLKRSIERIRAVCDEIECEAQSHAKRGAKFGPTVIYVAEVGRRCTAKFGGPSANSITRNRSTEPLKAIYIELRNSELKLPRIGDREQNATKSGDVATRSYITSLEQRLKASEAIVRGLTATLRRIKPISLDEALAISREGDVLDIAQGVQSTPSHADSKAIVEKLLRPEHLAAFGLIFDHSVFNPSTGEELLTTNEVMILRKLVCLP